MSGSNYEVISSKEVYKGHIFIVSVDKVRMPNGDVVERETLAHTGAVGMVPVTPDGKVLLVRQYRHAVRAYLLEIPAGKLDPGEDPRQCARRELLEEVGAETEELTEMTVFHNSPGYSSERFYLYLARVSGDLGPTRPDGHEEEEMEVVSLSLPEALALVDSGEIRDAKSIIGLLMAERRL